MADYSISENNHGTLNVADNELSLAVNGLTVQNSDGDVLLANAMPQAEYMYGCAPTAVAMLLGYYDLYGYRGKDFSALIEGDVALESRGTDGNKYNMNAFDTVLGRATATEDYVYRFYSRDDIGVITGNNQPFMPTSPEEELEYSFVNGGEGPELRTDIWNCIADYLGTGQIWRGNENLSTSFDDSTLEQTINDDSQQMYVFQEIVRTIDRKYTIMQYGLYLYVQSRGYALDMKNTGTFTVDAAGGDFTFDDYRKEIDAGRPVLVIINSHIMTGYGYNDETKEIIFDDCYEADRRMVWDGVYNYADADRRLEAITVVGFMTTDAEIDLAVAPIDGATEKLVVSERADQVESLDYCFFGTPLYLSFAVANLGKSDSGEFEACICFDGEETARISPISVAGETTLEEKNIRLFAEPGVGLHSIRVELDPDNEIPEISGLNNVEERSLMVLKKGTNVVDVYKQVGAGEVSVDDYVMNGAWIQVLEGGIASGTLIQGKVTNRALDGTVSFVPGIVEVSGDGLIRDAEVYEYGQLQISGTAEDLQVHKDGSAMVFAGGIVSGVSVESFGVLAVDPECVLTGRIRLETGATVSLEDGAILNFDLTQAEPDGEALVNDLSVIQGAPEYTITVSGEQTNGRYTLAEGAAGFDGTITVQNTLGESLGTLNVGETLSVDGIGYALALDESVLTLTVSGGTGSEVNIFSGDLTGETKDITSGWAAVDVNIFEEGVLNVYDGGTADGTTVNDFGIMQVSSGGTVTGTTVNADGLFYVSDKGTATGTMVDEDGRLEVCAGGTANGITVSESGRLSVYEGGTALDIAADSGAYLEFTVAPNTHIAGTSGGSSFEIVDGAVSGYTAGNSYLAVSTDGTATETTVDEGGCLEVFEGGTANSVTVNEGGSFNVYEGGSATEIKENGGYVWIEDDDANVTFVENSFSGLDLFYYSATVHSGTTATDITVDAGGGFEVYDGGVATGIVENGGYVYVEYGATATFVPNSFSGLHLKGSATVHSGTTATDTTVNKYGRLHVSSGGTANGATVNTSAQINVYSGGTVTGATVNSGGTIFLYSSGTATEIVENGGCVLMKDDVTATFASNTFSGLLLSRTSATVHSGTTAVDTTVINGELCVYSGGFAKDISAINGGDLWVSEGGLAVGVTVSGGKLLVESGGTAVSATTQKNWIHVYEGGTVSNATVSSGGSMDVYASGIACNTTISSGGSFIVNKDGKLTGQTTIEKGAVVLAKVGTILDFDISGIKPGAAARINDLSLITWEKATCTLTVSDSQVNGKYTLAEGVTTFTGTLTVKNTDGESLGTLSVGETLSVGKIRYALGLNDSALTLTVTGGSSGDNVFTGDVTSESKDITSGWSAVDVNVKEKGLLTILDGGTAENTTVSKGGSMHVSSGGMANITTVDTITDPRGGMTVFDGGTANITMVNFDGHLIVSSGGTANRTTVNGSFFVSNGGTANGATVNPDGGMQVLLGGTATDIKVYSGGSFGIIGTASNVTVYSGGRVTIASSGVLTGKMTFMNRAVVTLPSNKTVLDFDISELAPGADPRVNNLSAINKKLTYTLTVSGSQANGMYFLAEGAADFDSTITVRNADGESLGTLAVGETLTVGETSYTLSLRVSSLVLTVDGDGGGSGGNIFTGDVTNATKDITSGWSAVDVMVMSKGLLNIYSGGFALNATAARTGSMTVFEGGVALHPYIAESGTVNVSSGGRVVGTTIVGRERISAVLNVFDGGVADSTSIDIGGIMYVSGGGTANETWISQSGGLTVFSGGIANDTRVYGSMYVSGGGTANGLRLYNGKVNVSSGGKLTGQVICLNGTISVDKWSTVDFDLTQTLPGAAARIADLSKISGAPNFTVTVDADQPEGTYLLADGVPSFSKSITVVNTAGDALGSISVGAPVSIAGTMYRLNSDGDTLSLTVGTQAFLSPYTSNGLVVSKPTETVKTGNLYYDTFVGFGKLHVSSGGVASKTRIETRGSMFVSFGGYAENTEDVGYVKVESGGTAVRTSVGGSMYIASGGTALNITENGGCVTIEDGATVTFAPNAFIGLYVTKDNFSSVTVHSGTTANRIIVYYGGKLCVYDGGVANDVTLTRYNYGDAGYLHVSSGGVANRTVINSRAIMYVSSGGTANYTKVTDYDPYVSSGIMHVLDGGVANFTSIYTAGSMYVSGGGRANDTSIVVRGSMFVLSGGMADRTTVGNGILNISSGGTANDTMVSSGGRMFVSGGGSATGTTVSSGGSFFVNEGGTATGIEAKAGANLGFTVAPDTVIAGTSAGSAFEIRDGAVSGYAIENGRLTVASGGLANGVKVGSGGSFFVNKGGTATDVAVSAGAYLGFTVAPDTVIAGTSAGSAFEIRDGAVSGYAIENGRLTVSSGCMADDTTVNSGGSLYLYGGTANGTTVNDGGNLNLDGGTANDTTVNSGGSLYLYGGVANSATVNDGGFMDIFGGTANDTMVNSGGSVIVSSGGTAGNTTVNDGGNVNVVAGGVAGNPTVKAGGSLTVSGGGKLTGQMAFEEGAVVSMKNAAVIDFDISGLTPEAGPLLDGFSVIQGTPGYTLTVSEEQAGGIFVLAEGVAEFAGTITVCKGNTQYRGIAVGGTAKVGYNSYTLNLTDSVLSVTADVPDLTPQETSGTADQVSWEETGANCYIVEYSTDGFEHVVQVVTGTSATDMMELPAGTYQWRVKADANSDWAIGDEIVSEPESDTPKVVQSNEDSNNDLFFASPVGTWDNRYFALHIGSLNDWKGTKDRVMAEGKGRIQNLFFGSADPNVLCLTDSENGDAIFVDDVFTELPEDVETQVARLYRIQEIRAGAGDDIVDMTSQRFEYVGDGLTVYGGDGDDVIWANKGDNLLFGDAGNDRIIGASGDDVIVGGIGNDTMHGGGGDDVFTFCDNWGTDTVRQIESGSVTLWFASGNEWNWDEETLTYTDGDNRVTVSGVTADQVTLKFGDDFSSEYLALSRMGAFADFSSERVFEESGKGLLAGNS